jgi:ketopantoate reductase
LISNKEIPMQHHWVRFAERDGSARFGTLEGDRVRLWHGNMFEYPQRGDRTIAVADVRLLLPVQPTKVIALWNNFRALGDKLGLAAPAEPLYLVKAPNSYLEPGGTILHPGGSAKVVYEGEREGDRFPLGELDGRVTERVQRVADCFTRAGFKAPVLEDIRSEIWLKLWGNLTFNPISGLAHATLVDICQYPLSRGLPASMMQEAQLVAEKLGIRFRVPLDKRIAGAEKVGHHKTSMLQDIEAGRAPEIDALVGSVAELARLTNTPTPHIDTVYALVKLLAKNMEAGQGRVRMQAV